MIFQPESVYPLPLKKQQENHWITLAFFYYQMISEHYVRLQSSIYSTIKNIVKNLIYWDQAKWFCSIHSDMRALSMQVVLYRYEQKTSKLDFGKWQFFFKTLLFANGLSYYALLGLEWKIFCHILSICFQFFNRY